jgi:hypothetical protein
MILRVMYVRLMHAMVGIASNIISRFHLWWQYYCISKGNV